MTGRAMERENERDGRGKEKLIIKTDKEEAGRYGDEERI